MDIENIKRLIETNSFIRLREEFVTETNLFVSNISSERFSTLAAHPNSESFMQIINDYENFASDLIEAVIILTEYVDDDRYSDILIEVFMKVLYKPSNENAGYGYIWKHISNYPLLLLLYAVGIICIKLGKYKFLFKVMNIQITQRYFGYNNVEYFKTSLIEAINCYHVFNNVDNINVSVVKYFPNANENQQSDTRNEVLRANNRVYQFIRPKMVDLFVNEVFFDESFDLFEFFIGLDIMYKRVKEKSLLFAPYGRRFWIYSQSGRYYSYKDTIVLRFIEDTLLGKNDILKIGFFDNNSRNFEIALKEYINLLQRLTDF